ncbi:hypothetical protein [Streptomyces sp. NBC_00829]|uniref:hypothetical protein n=1 Tax=Streptomyces sp. NBC_00829 TaxID=2903679 RepID=UPI003865D912|nr:hypothetical protein OG293_36190 [Streptomyces sp. NBC_00829]
MEEAGAALVVLAHAGQALVEVGVSSGVGVCVAQVREEGYGLVVGGGLLGGDVRLDLLPGGFGIASEGCQVLGAGGGPSQPTPSPPSSRSSPPPRGADG